MKRKTSGKLSVAAITKFRAELGHVIILALREYTVLDSTVVAAINERINLSASKIFADHFLRLHHEVTTIPPPSALLKEFILAYFLAIANKLDPPLETLPIPSTDDVIVKLADKDIFVEPQEVWDAAIKTGFALSDR